MTDDTLDPRRTRDLRAYAERGVRPIDALAIAHGAIGLQTRPRFSRTTYALLAAALVLALAAMLAVGVGSRPSIATPSPVAPAIVPPTARPMTYAGVFEAMQTGRIDRGPYPPIITSLGDGRMIGIQSMRAITVWDGSTGETRKVGSTTVDRSTGAHLVPLVDGRVLIVGGDLSDPNAPGDRSSAASTAEIFDFATGVSHALGVVTTDGTRIVFNTHALNAFQVTTLATNLYTIRPDGTGLTQVTHFGDNDTRASQPSWTPDGTQILFTEVLRNASNPWGNRHAAFIDPDGSNLQVLDGVFATHPRLRPTP